MRLPLLAASLLVAAPALAQTAPSITSADLPQAGDTLRLSQTVGLPAGAPGLGQNGPNQTWNYTSLVPLTQRVERYSDVGTAAGALLQLTFNNSLFSPDTKATVVSPQSLPAAAGALPVSDPLLFANVSSADYRLVGYGVTFSGTAIPVTYASRAQQDVIYRLPLAYGSAATVSNSLLTTPLAAASTGYFSQKRQRTNLPDAWGTLTTPFGTFQTLRVVTTIVDHDSIAMGGMPGQGLTLPTQREYKWLAKGVHVPVLTITTTSVAGQETVTLVEYRDSYRKLTPLATHNAALDAGLACYPNPSAAGTALRLTVPGGSGPVTVQATDVVGKSVFSRHYPSPAGEVTLDAAAFGSYRGVLLLTVQTSQGTATRRVVRQ